MENARERFLISVFSCSWPWLCFLTGLTLIIPNIWQAWAIVGPATYAGGDGKSLQMQISTFQKFAPLLEINILNPLQGLSGFATPLNIWANPVVSGDVFTILAADLQDPPEQILLMLDQWCDGSKFVVSARASRADPFVTRVLSLPACGLIALKTSMDITVSPINRSRSGNGKTNTPGNIN